MILSSTKKHKIISIFIILIIGVGVRLYQLDNKGLWSDELTTAMMVLYHPLTPSSGDNDWFHHTDVYHVTDLDTFWTAKSAEQTPPLFDLIAKASTTIIGRSEIGLRLPSSLASIFTLLWLLFQAWKEYREKKSYVFLWVFFLSVISSAYIQYAQEARAYSLGVLFSGILCTGWYLRISGDLKNAELPGWCEIFIFVLACYTHYFLIVLSAILLGFYMLTALYRKDWKAVIRISFVPIIFIPWFLMSFTTLIATSAGSFSPLASISREHALERSLLLTTQLAGQQFILFVIAIIWLVLAKLLYTKSDPKEFYSFLRPVFVLITTIFLYILFISQLLRLSGIWSNRYFIFILPFVYLVAGIFLNNLVRNFRTLFFICVILAATQIAEIRDYFNKPKEGYREAVSWLQPKLKSDSIVVTTWAPNRIFYRYYLDQADKKLQQISVSGSIEAPSLCNRLRDTIDFGVIAHVTHYPFMIENVVACNGAFQVIDTVSFPSIVAQHWRRVHN